MLSLFWTPFFVWHGCSIYSPKRWKSHLSITVGARKKSIYSNIFLWKWNAKDIYDLCLKWNTTVIRSIPPMIATHSNNNKRISLLVTKRGENKKYGYWQTYSKHFMLNEKMRCIPMMLPCFQPAEQFSFVHWKKPTNTFPSCFMILAYSLAKNYLIWFTFVAIVTVDWLDFISTDFMCNAHPYSNRIVMETKRDGKRETTCLM